MGGHLREQHDSCVGHGIGEAQDAAAHDGVTEVEHGHAKGRVSWVLLIVKVKQ